MVYLYRDEDNVANYVGCSFMHAHLVCNIPYVGLLGGLAFPIRMNVRFRIIYDDDTWLRRAVNG